MLERPGDLIPVKATAASIPWTRRRSQILNFLHRGPVNFSTLVYDTNVGDISSLASYFNEERISVDDLNSRFGHHPFSGGDTRQLEEAAKIGSENVVMPRLLLYPERSESSSPWEGEARNTGAEQEYDQSQVTVQRTMDWVMSQKLKARAKVATIEEEASTLGDSGRNSVLSALLARHSSNRDEHDCGSSRSAATKRWSGTGGGVAMKGAVTEPSNLAAALDVVSRALCDGTWTTERELAHSW